MNNAIRGLLLASLVLTGVPAWAGIITPVSAVDHLGNAGFTGNEPGRLIDGSGLSGIGPVLGQTLFGTPTNGIPHDGNNWKVGYGIGGPNVEVTFDLGGLASLTDVHIWNYDSQSHSFWDGPRDTKNIRIETSTDGVIYTFATNVLLTQASDTQVPESVQTFGLAGSATHVRFTDMTNWAGRGHGSELGLGEVRFSGTLAAPEPGMVLLIVTGLLGGLAARHARA